MEYEQDATEQQGKPLPRDKMYMYADGDAYAAGLRESAENGKKSKILGLFRKTFVFDTNELSGPARSKAELLEEFCPQQPKSWKSTRLSSTPTTITFIGGGRLKYKPKNT